MCSTDARTCPTSENPPVLLAPTERACESHLLIERHGRLHVVFEEIPLYRRNRLRGSFFGATSLLSMLTVHAVEPRHVLECV